MTLHPDCQAVLDHVASWPAFTDLTATDARAVEARRHRELAGALQPVHESRELTIPVGDGVELGALLLRPHVEQAPGVLVWLHGGGWVVGSPPQSEDQARAIANASGCSVLSVDYRLGPEHPFPTPLEDAYAAVAWAAGNAEALGARPGRLAVGGDSAGGNLAAGVTLLARERGGPRIDVQALVYPVTCRHDAAPSGSRARYADGYWLSNETMTWCWENYLAREEQGADPHASPLRAESLAGLPPAFVLLAECDVLYDEGRDYAERLRDAGVPVELRSHPGMLHGFIACAGMVDAAWTALREVGAAVGAGLAVPAAAV